MHDNDRQAAMNGRLDRRRVFLDDSGHGLFAARINLVAGTGPIGQRQMSFRNRAQVDVAYAQFLSRQEPTQSVHHKVQTMMRNPVFICWQDIE